MLPTFQVTDDWVLVSRLYRGGKGIVVGDIVTFDSVVEPGEKVIKRVLGLEGDYVLRDTPGKGDTMIQVCRLSHFALVVLINGCRFLEVMFGLWGTICRIRETRDILVRYREL